MLATVNLFAGLAWNPGVRGILTVVLAVAVLMGSVYVILSTNVGARLGLLVALAGLFGFGSILAMLWWLLPPANGPRGNNPRWEVVEVYVNDGEPAETQEIESLIPPDQLPSSDELIAAHPNLADEYPNGFVLSDLQANNPDIIEDVLPKDSMNGWRLTPSSSAGEAQTAADTALIEQKLFAATTDYKKLNTFEFGGKPRRADACDDGDLICRARFRVERLLTFWDNPVHYAVVQIQPVIPQETQPGEAPPLPIVDPDQPVYSIVLVRDLGDVRLIPFLYFVISFSLFILFAWVLHNREKTLEKNKAMAEAALGGG